MTRLNRSSKTLIFIAGIALLGGSYYYSQNSHNKEKSVASPAKTPVQIVKTTLAEKKSIPITLYANGYVTPIKTVDVRPQIQNVVRAIHVKEGQEVKAGQLLLTLDGRNDTFNLEKAQAQLAKDKSDLQEAEGVLQRNLELLKKNFISPAMIDTLRSRVASLQSIVRADQAAISSGNVVLGYNKIHASISGKVGAINVHEGSLAQPAGLPMLSIAQLDPITISFAVPERELSAIIATYPKGDAPVFASLPGMPESAPLKGKLVFIDNSSDAQTGTIKMKAEFANPRRLLWPGVFANLHLISRTLKDAIVVPAQAIVTGPTEQFVYLVQADQTVKIQKINLLAIENGQAAVTGLNAGDRVVLEGGQNLRPGNKIKEMSSSQTGAGNKNAAPKSA